MAIVIFDVFFSNSPSLATFSCSINHRTRDKRFHVHSREIWMWPNISAQEVSSVSASKLISNTSPCLNHQIPSKGRKDLHLHLKITKRLLERIVRLRNQQKPWENKWIPRGFSHMGSNQRGCFQWNAVDFLSVAFLLLVTKVSNPTHGFLTGMGGIVFSELFIKIMGKRGG